MVDQGVRADTGITLGLGVNAIGYAKGQGTPKVASFDATGVFTLGQVAEAFDALDKKPEPSVRRDVRRVIPLDAKDDKVRVSVDYIETTPDKTRRVHCGPSAGAFVSFEGPSIVVGADGASHETVECRTVRTAAGFGALESTLQSDGQKLRATLGIGSTVLARRETGLKGGDRPGDRYAFTLLGAAQDAVHSVYVARFNGSVIISRGAAEAAEPAEASSFWLGTATNPPAAALYPDSEGAVVWNTLMAKPDLYATRFTFEKKPEAPKAVVLPDEPGLEERGSVFVLARDMDNLVLTGEKVGGKRTMKLRRFDSSAKMLSVLPVGGEDETVQDGKLALLPSGDVLLVYLTLDRAKGYTIKRVVASCGTASSAGVPQAPSP